MPNDVRSTAPPWAPGALGQAARNIADRVGQPPEGVALVVYAEAKRFIAERVIAELAARGIETHALCLAPLGERASERTRARFLRWLRDVRGQWGLVLLLQPQQAPLLFDLVGRPDQGVVGSLEHITCDWLISPEGLVRTVGVDMAELNAFRRRLLAALSTAHEIRILTRRGTDLRLRPREWTATDGEVYTAPVETSAQGTVVFDGSAYSGLLSPPLTLCLDAGRVTNLDRIEADTPQLAMVLHDLSRDTGARQVAELGLGINPGARRDADIMEAEQARGTCHIGFGHNAAFGGRNESAVHTDYCILRPTIEVDNTPICVGGAFCI